MAMCEDFPCCGHEMGCCPRFDESGRQLDMVCTCGARLPVNNQYSICDSCLKVDREWDDGDWLSKEDREEIEELKNDDCGMEDDWLDGYMEDRMSGGDF